VGTAALSIGVVAIGAAAVDLLLAVVVVAGLVSAGLAARWLARASGGPIRIRFDLLREHAGYGLRAFAVSILVFLLLRSDILIIQMLLGTTETGYYAVSVAVTEVLRIVPMVFGMQLLARLARDSTARGPWRTTQVSTVGIGLLMLVIALAAVPLASPLITLLYGGEFSASVAPFIILLPGLVFVAMHGVLSSYIASMGMPSGAIAAPAAAVVVNVLLNVAMIPSLGIQGAALASTTSYALLLAATLVYVVRLERSGDSAGASGLRSVGENRPS
jgi:O-antigen/teichoic acid export membrane protein